MIPFKSLSFTQDSQKPENKLPITLQLESLAVQKLLVEQIVGQRLVDTGAAAHKLVVAVHQSLEQWSHRRG